MVIIKKERFVSEKSVSYKKVTDTKNFENEDISTVKGHYADKLKKMKTDDAEPQSISIGAAVDIGTTSIAVSLFELNDEICIGNETQINSQTMYGSDVMMRIMHCVNGKEQLLHDMLVSQIEDIMDIILAKASGEAKSGTEAEKYKDMTAGNIIRKMVVVGNTTMCHIFLNKDVTGLKGAPFYAAYEGSCTKDSGVLGFKKYRIDDIIVLSGIKAHVGADAAAVLCKEKLYKKDVNEIAIDIGTNAEILLNKSGKVYVSSTAAGPAFEGKGIRAGMRAAPGAINSVKISRVNGNIILGMLDDGNVSVPKGLCGSGLIDAISELLKARVLTKDGYLLTKEEALSQNVNINLCECLECDDKDGNYFVLSKEQDVVITQKDIRNIQLAKGAIRAGTEILLEKAGLTINEIDSIKIAGVFGKYIHAASAIAIGLLPAYPNKLSFIGNAAGDGAAIALFEDEFVKEMEKQVKKATHIELADGKSFQDKFLDAMELKEWYYK